MKKKYVKPELNTIEYAEFEEVFTACSKGNEKARDELGGHCSSDIYDYPYSYPSWSAAFKSNFSS